MLSFVWLFLFTQSKNNPVLELRTGHFRGLGGFEAKAKDLKMCSRGQGRPRGLHLCNRWLRLLTMYLFRLPTF